MSWICEVQPEWAGTCPESAQQAPWQIFARRVHAAFGDQRMLILVATILGSSMAFIDTTVVNVALPKISRDLDLSLAGTQWVFLSYSLALGCFYLTAGGAGDRVGYRTIFIGGTIGFVAASVLAGAATSGAFLIVARTLQGVAGAFLTTGSLALLRSTFGAESGRAVGIWTAWTGISAIVGPPIGGALTEFSSWRLIFFINVPVAAGVVALVGLSRRGRPADEPIAAPSHHRPFDLGGAFLLAVGLGSLTYALVESPGRGVGAIWWAIVLAVATLGGGLLFEARTPDPMLPLPLFRRRNFVAANAVTLFVYASLAGSTFFLVIYLQSVVGYSPLEASLTLIPISIVMLLLAGRFGKLADARGPRLFLTLGPGLLAAGILLWALVDDRSRWWALVIGLFVFALGLAVTVAPITATALRAAPERFSGVAAGLNNTVSRVGGLIAVAVLGLVISLVFQARTGVSAPHALGEEASTPALKSASVDAFRAALFVAAGLAVAGGAIAAAGVSNAEARSEAT